MEHPIVDDVFDKDRDEALDSCRFELFSGVFAPAQDLGIPLGVVAAFVKRQLPRNVGHRPRCRLPSTRRDCGASRNLLKRLLGPSFVRVRIDYMECEVMAVLADEDHGRRLVAGEAQQLDGTYAANLDLRRQRSPTVAAVADHDDWAHLVMHRGEQIGQFVG